MRVHFLSGENITLTVDGGEKVSIVKKRIQEISGRPFEKISLLLNGMILNDDYTMQYYGINDESTLTVVRAPPQNDIPIEQQEKEVEQYLISLCRNMRQRNASSEKITDEESIQIFKQVAVKKTEPARTANLDDIVTKLIYNDALFSEVSHVEFFDSIITNPNLVREMLLVHPIIIKLIELNPGLQEFIEKDENIREVIAIIQRPKDSNRSAKRLNIIKLVEEKLGHSLVFAPEHIAFIKQHRLTLTNKETVESKKEKEAKPVVTQRQLNAIIMVISNHPEIALKFMKSTPVYKHLIHKNPALLKSILTPERLRKLFTKESLSTLIHVNEQLRNMKGKGQVDLDRK